MFNSSPKPPVANQAPAYGALRVSTSCYGGVIVPVLGCTRANPNLIWAGDFHSVATQSGGASGKSGGGSGSGGTTTYTYYASALHAVCHGPISGIGAIWKAKSVTNLAKMNGTLLEGSHGQAPWSYLSAKHPDKALGYSELACVGFANLSLGDSNQMPNFGFEIMGMGPPANVGHSIKDGHFDLQPLDLGTNVFDAATAAQIQAAYDGIVADIAAGKTPVWDTHVAWSVNKVLLSTWGSQFPAVAIGDHSLFSTYCQAHGFFMSVYLDEARASSDQLNEWVQATQAEFVWSNRLLDIVPYGRVPVTGNGVTYAPDNTPVFDLGPDDFVRASSDDAGPLVKVTRPKLADLYNRVKVEFIDRSNAYNIAIATAEDPAHIETYGLREAPVIKAHQIQDSAIAQLAADMALARHVNAVAQAEFPLGWRHCRLEPMKDLVTLTDPESDLDHWLVLVTGIEEDDAGRLMVTAEEVPDGIAIPRARISFQQTDCFSLDVSAEPGNANAPVFFEPPDALTTTGLEVWVAASGGPLWGGAELWVSETGESYAYGGRINGPCSTGVLAAPLPMGTATDTTSVLAVDLTESNGTLQSVDQVDALSLNTLCWVGNDAGDGELLAYRDATLVDISVYNLGYLMRGAYGTAIQAHAQGSRFVRVDGLVGKYPFRADQIGKTVYVKLLSFNIWGGVPQDLADVEPYAYRFQGAALASPLPVVEGFTTAYQGGIGQTKWRPIEDFRSSIDYEVRMGQTPDTARFLCRTPNTQAPTFGDGLYWLAAHFKVPNGPDVYSQDWVDLEITGSQLVSNIAASWSEALSGWTGTFTNTMVEGGRLALAAVGDVRTAGDITAVQDVIFYGGVQGSGTYQIAAGRRVILTRTATCNVLITLGTVLAQSDSVADVRSVADVAAVGNISGISLGTTASAIPQIRLSQDFGATWGAWQDWMPGAYTANGFDFGVELATSDPTIPAILPDIVIEVDVPAFTQSGTGLAVPAAGLQINFPQTFNGGPGGVSGGAPNLQITLLGAQEGDRINTPPAQVTTAGFFIQITNGGAGVARTINWAAQGY